MTTANHEPASPPDAGPPDRDAALFAGLVLQQAATARIFLGQEPHPGTGKKETNLEAAGHFIDTLAMLSARTRGNLSPPESAMLEQTLMSLRLAFVEAANAGSSPATSGGAPAGDSSPSGAPAAPAAKADAAGAASEGAKPDEGSARRFVKHY